MEQAIAEQLAEQVMIAIPALFLVERNDEDIGVLQLLQDRLAISPAGEGITEAAGEPLEYGGLQKELAQRLSLAGQHLFPQVIDNVMVAAGKGGDEPIHVFP